jgi:hypothetical protein
MDPLLPAVNPSHDIFDMIKTLAAFGGFGLGFVNLGIMLYRDFWRKGKLLATVDSAIAKAVEAGLYDIQIIIRLEARGDDVFLNSMTIGHSENVFGPYNAKNTCTINRVYPYTARNLVNLSKDEFEKEVRGLDEKCLYVRDLQINKDSQLTITLIDRLEGINFLSDWQEWAKNGWNIDIRYRDQSLTIPFSWDVHPQSLAGFFR